jgi:hypothetical protein
MFYFSPVKSLLAMFFSVALILSQAAFMAAAGDSGAQKTGVTACCGHCEHCNKEACCTSDANSRPSAPAVPAHGLSQNEWQLLTAVTIRFLLEAPSQSPALSSPFFFHPSVAAPLYQRDCSYLI